MSQDDGYILRENSDGKYVLQHYFASVEYPPIDSETALRFDNMEDAVRKYHELEDTAYPSEYGLTVQVNPKESKMQTNRYNRKSFSVDAVQVTEENMEEVAKWCQGQIREENSRKYIQVRVVRPLTERQTKAFAGDWILYAGTGYKVYTNKAFVGSFDLDPSVEHNDGETQNVFEQPQPSSAELGTAVNS